jgi:hypothetical protein
MANVLAIDQQSSLRITHSHDASLKRLRKVGTTDVSLTSVCEIARAFEPRHTSQGFRCRATQSERLGVKVSRN